MASLQPIGGFAGNPSPQPISAEETQADGDKAGDQPPPVVQSTKNRYVIERRSDIDKEIVEGNRRERRSSAVVMWGAKLGQISPESYKMVVEKRKELEQRLYNHTTTDSRLTIGRYRFWLFIAGLIAGLFGPFCGSIHKQIVRSWRSFPKSSTAVKTRILKYKNEIG